MALNGTWTFSDNQTPTDQSSVTQTYRSFMIQFKEFLVNSLGWSVAKSCNSSAVSSDNVDNWGTTLTNVVQYQSGDAHSWIVLLSPEGFIAGANGSYVGTQSRLYLLIDCSSNSAGQTYYYACFSLHKTLPTGGTTTAAPTSTDSVGYFSSAGNFQIIDSSTRVNKFHFRGISTGAGSPAKGKGQFQAFVSNTNLNGMGMMLTCVPMWAVQATPTNNYAYETGILLITYQNFTSLPVSTIFNNIQGWNNSGTPNTTGLDGYCLSNLTNNNLLGVNVTGTGDIAGRLPASDIFIYNNTSGSCFPIGKVTDHAITGATPANFTACESGTIEHNTILCSGGSLIVPVNNTTFVAG